MLELGGDINIQNIQDIVTSNACTEKDMKDFHMLDKCTAATSTEELLSYSCAEVQTVPYDILESESESNDEPIENLSVSNTNDISNTTNDH